MARRSMMTASAASPVDKRVSLDGLLLSVARSRALGETLATHPQCVSSRGMLRAHEAKGKVLDGGYEDARHASTRTAPPSTYAMQSLDRNERAIVFQHSSNDHSMQSRRRQRWAV